MFSFMKKKANVFLNNHQIRISERYTRETSSIYEYFLVEILVIKCVHAVVNGAGRGVYDTEWPINILCKYHLDDPL